MKKQLSYCLILLFVFSSCEKEVPLDRLSYKLENTIWIEDENYKGCDCGFSSVVGFKDGIIYELNEIGNESTSCLPYNFLVRDYSGKITDYRDEKNKISFKIVYKTFTIENEFFIEIEIVNRKLRIISRGRFDFVQEYNLSETEFVDNCN